MKILFFDTWTKGIRNFSRLTPELDKAKCEYKLFHIESWGDKNVSPYIKLMNIDCYDISYYKTSYLYDVFRIESPDVVLILSLSYLLDRTIVDICNNLGIKVFYLAHGKIYMKLGVGNLKKSTSLFSRVVDRLNSKQSKILFNYIFFNIFTSMHPKRIYSTMLEFFKRSENTMFTRYSEEFKVAKGMVYYNAEKVMFEEQRDFPKGMIEAVGNPEMDFIINSQIMDKPFFLESISFYQNRYALYLDDGFVQENILSNEEWLLFITQVLNVLKSEGIGLIIKLHPRTDVTYLNSFFAQNDIKAIKDVDFKNLVYHSDFVFSHSSSTVIYAMILNKPIILPRWGKMTHLIHNYPDDVVNYCTSIDDFEMLISSENIPLKQQNNYIKEKCGVLDGKAVERITNILLGNL